MGVNKFVYGGTTKFDLTGDTVTPEVLMEGYTAHAANGDRIVGTAIGGIQEKLLKDTVGWTGKNRLKNTLESYTSGSGLEVTVYDDKSIKLNGTPSYDTYVKLNGENNAIALDDTNTVYTLTGCPNGLDSTKCFLIIANFGADTGTGFTGQLPSGVNDSRAWIFVKSGYTVTNKVFYPMLRLASNPDSTYEPYHEDVVDVLRDAEVVEGKNLNFGKLVQGVITGTGAYNNSITTRVCITDYIPVTAGETYVVSVDTLLEGKIVQFNAHYYSAQSEASHTGYEPDWTESGGSITIPSDTTAYMRFSVRVSDSSTVTPSDFSNLMICTLDEWNKSHAYEPYYVPVKDAMLRREEQRVLGAKNFAKPVDFSSQVINGITWTKNSDGIWTTSGTIQNTAAQSWVNVVDNFYLSKGEYILSGCPQDGEIGNFDLGFYDYNTLTWVWSGAEGNKFTISDSNVNHRFRICAMIWANSTHSGTKIWKPMIRLASDPDDTYVPYAMTNAELTTNNNSILSDLVTLGRKDIVRFILANTSPTGVKIGNLSRNDAFIVIWEVNAFGNMGIFWLSYRYDNVAVIKDIAGNSALYFTATLSVDMNSIKLRATGAGGGAMLYFIPFFTSKDYTFTTDNT